MARAYLGLGSNLGDRAASLAGARQRLQAAGAVLEALSSLYRTEPVGRADQPEFLNQVLAIGTDRDPERLLVLCLEIEAAMGRSRAGGDRPGGPRCIDIDLLLSDDQERSGPGLVLPHPEMHRRRFVLVPLVEIAPAALHPGLERTVARLLADLEAGGKRLPAVIRAEAPAGSWAGEA